MEARVLCMPSWLTTTLINKQYATTLQMIHHNDGDGMKKKCFLKKSSDDNILHVKHKPFCICHDMIPQATLSKLRMKKICTQYLLPKLPYVAAKQKERDCSKSAFYLQCAHHCLLTSHQKRKILSIQCATFYLLVGCHKWRSVNASFHVKEEEKKQFSCLLTMGQTCFCNRCHFPIKNLKNFRTQMNCKNITDTLWPFGFITKKEAGVDFFFLSFFSCVSLCLNTI